MPLQGVCWIALTKHHIGKPLRAPSASLINRAPGGGPRKNCRAQPVKLIRSRRKGLVTGDTGINEPGAARNSSSSPRATRTRMEGAAGKSTARDPAHAATIAGIVITGLQRWS